MNENGVFPSMPVSLSRIIHHSQYYYYYYYYYYFLADFSLQEQAEGNPMIAFSRVSYNSSYTMATKPIKSLELHYTMIQFFIICVMHPTGILQIANGLLEQYLSSVSVEINSKCQYTCIYAHNY